jgi:hypothetical protein
MSAIGCAQELASMMQPAKDLEGQQGQVRRLPQRVRPALLPVDRVSAEEFWNDKRARQARSHNRVVSGEIAQSALFAFSSEQLRGAEIKWPKGGFSALENDDDAEERSASALQPLPSGARSTAYGHRMSSQAGSSQTLTSSAP